MTEERHIEVDWPGVKVSIRLETAREPRAFCVLAHGAGAGMDHPFMESMAHTLVGQGITTMRFNFPFMDRGGFPPDPLPVLLASARAVLSHGVREADGLPLFVCGKSLGGRILSLSVSETHCPSLRGFVFLGYPLHSPKTFGLAKGEHLLQQSLPQLFLSGSRDKLAHMDILRPFVESIGPHATLVCMEGADHGFGYRKIDAPPSATITEVLSKKSVNWINEILSGVRS